MFRFSRRSQERLSSVEPVLAQIVTDAMAQQLMDFTVLCGVRSLEEQKSLVAQGKSRTLRSRHLPNRRGLSEAIDLAPYPIDWSRHEDFHRLAGIILSVAQTYNIELRWGGDWNKNGITTDQRFIDLPHFELPLRFTP